MFHRTKFRFTCSFLFLVGASAGMRAPAQPLNERVLVVYSQASQESQDVARFYAGQRAIPPQNLCPISPPSDRRLAEPDYETFVKTPIQQCLYAVGRENILYIVLTYGAPYLIDRLRGPFAIDSYLADIWDYYPENYAPLGPAVTHGYYAESQDQGGWFQPFLSLADYRRQPGSDLIYSVWRLDGPTPQIAMNLVSQAIAAEQAGGPSGQACLDRNRGDLPFPDFGYFTADWDLHEAAQFASAAGFPVIEDPDGEEFGTPPAPNCPNAALYSGWYSYNNYNDAFTWNTGAIGWHLDSASALDPRGGSNWAAGALAKGITVTSGAVNEPFLEGLVRPGGASRNLLEGANAGDAFLRNTRWLKWMILNIGDPLYRPFAGGRPPFNPPVAADSLEIEPRAVVGGERFSTGIIHLGAPAPQDTTFSLSTSDPGLASVDSTATVPAGSDTAMFAIRTAATSAVNAVTITARSDSDLLVNTVETAPLLGALFFEPEAVTGGAPEIGTVYLNDIAPVDTLINLSSDNPQLAATPDNVVIPAGASAGSFPVSVSPVAAFAAVNVTAVYGGATVSEQVLIFPGSGPGGGSSQPVRRLRRNRRATPARRTRLAQ